MLTRFEKSGEKTVVNRVPAQETHIYAYKIMNSVSVVLGSSIKYTDRIHWTKYQIKETDMRVKTATFSSPEYFDLTTGRVAVLITSPYHESFAGTILSVSYNDKEGVYDYQCQDWSRNYVAQNVNANFLGGTTTINILKSYLTLQGTSVPVPTQAQLEKNKEVLSGLRPAADYEQSSWGSTMKFNPMTEKPTIIIRDVNSMALIRGLIYGTGAYIDLWFNNNGVLQVEPYNKDDWMNTGLHLEKPEAINQKYKFDTTNIITQVTVSSNEDTKVGTTINDETLMAFFGRVKSVIKNPNPKSTTDDKTAKTVSGTQYSGSNPYKTKKVWINADNGSDDMKNEVAKLIKEAGYDVHIGRTGSNVHYEDYSNVPKDYIYITMYNGFCACTTREAYSSKIQNQLKAKNVQLVTMWESRTWTNPNGMQPYRYGDFTGYSATRAWDDNFCSFDPRIPDVAKFLKDNKAIYCVYPNARGLVDQFLAGGYLNSKK